MQPSMATLIHPFCLKSLMIACNWSIYPRLCGHQWPLITSICCKKYRNYPQPISMIYPWKGQNLYLWCNMDKGYAFRKMSVLSEKISLFFFSTKMLIEKNTTYFFIWFFFHNTKIKIKLLIKQLIIIHTSLLPNLIGIVCY